MATAGTHGTARVQAQNQAQRVTPETLQEALADLRYDYDRESAIDITASAPPITRQLLQDGSLEITEEPGSQVGMSLSSPMIRLVGHHEGFGLIFSIRRALHGWERFCRSKHQRWPDHVDAPVCAVLTWGTVRDKFSPAFMAAELEVSYPRAERMLATAIAWIRRREEMWEDEERERTFTGHDRSMCALCRAFDAELA